MPTFERQADVHVLDLGADTNRIDPRWIEDVAAALDAVVEAEPPRALVTTASGEFFGMGFDLEWMAANRDGVGELVAAMHDLVARTLELPAPTVAAIPGHAIAGGALFALAHDYRVMREDRGFFCLPEIDVRIAISPGLIDLTKARLSPQVAHEALTTGARYTSQNALDAAIVDAIVAADELVPKAIEMATRLSEKDAETYGAVKARLYRDVARSLRDREANAADFGKFEAAISIIRGIA